MNPDGAVDVARSRAATYRLLARLALAEIDLNLAYAMREVPMLGQALEESGGLDGLQSLRAEYARLFLLGAQPYEAAFLDPSGLLNTDLSARVEAHYRRHRYDPDPSRRPAAADHLGLELEFLAHLVDREASALSAIREDVAEVIRQEEASFLEEHLLRWGPVFGFLIAESARLPFYGVFGELLQQFLMTDFELLQSHAC